MAQREGTFRPSDGISLSVRVSLWLITAAVIPLLVAIGISEWYARPTLTNQARRAIETDAQTHAQLISNYFKDRILDVQSLAQVPLAQDLLLDPVNHRENIPLIVQNGKVVGAYLDPHYTLWALFDLRGNLVLSYSSTGATFQPHGRYTIPPEDIRRLLSGQPFVSAVYYNPSTKKASVDIYVPSYSLTLKRPLGFVRATLTLDYIWSIVDSETGANGNGSYAFILDENGVRIADPDPTRRFTAIAPLSPAAQQEIGNEARYGEGKTAPVVPDNALQQKLHEAQGQTTFDIQPAGKNEQFLATRQTLSVVPWTYVVLSPINTVVAVANQQLIITIIIVLLVLLPAALVGLAVGRRITSPILRSVGLLQSSSEALATLASRQKSAAAEQVWVVEASQEGLKSIQYYSGAAQVAVDQMNTTGTSLMRHWHALDEELARHALVNIVDASKYVNKAIKYQTASNDKLATALNVTTQVSEQLASGSVSAFEASRQLQQVVNDLRHVVGR